MLKMLLKQENRMHNIKVNFIKEKQKEMMKFNNKHSKIKRKKEKLPKMKILLVQKKVQEREKSE